MLKTTTYQQLDQFLQEKYEVELSKMCKVLSTAVSDSSKWETTNFDLTKLRLPNKAKRKTEQIKLAVIQWYFPEEVRFLFRLWLEENLVQEFKADIEILLSSKENALGYLLINDRWSDSDFWGNIMSPNRSLFNWFDSRFVRFEPHFRKAKKAVYHRGYRDKGSMRPSHVSVRFDYRKLLTEEDLEVEYVAVLNYKSELLRKISDRLQREFCS